MSPKSALGHWFPGGPFWFRCLAHDDELVVLSVQYCADGYVARYFPDHDQPGKCHVVPPANGCGWLTAESAMRALDEFYYG